MVIGHMLQVKTPAMAHRHWWEHLQMHKKPSVNFTSKRPNSIITFIQKSFNFVFACHPTKTITTQHCTPSRKGLLLPAVAIIFLRLLCWCCWWPSWSFLPSFKSKNLVVGAFNRSMQKPMNFASLFSNSINFKSFLVSTLKHEKFTI